MPRWVLGEAQRPRGRTGMYSSWEDVFALLKQLIHNGIVIPEPPQPRGLTILVRGQPVALTPKQEEMAMAWARKQGTPYVQDEVFCANFMRDFSKALGIEPPLTLEEVDFSACYAVVEAERRAKEALTKEERRALAAARKAQREALKARYGYAIVNGQRVELGNYMAEPSGIFMGRGQHPLRGSWKEGAQQKDVTLNLSPDAPRPEGDWAEIVWQPESLWVARWEDKLSGKLKYIWLSDTAPVKQRREASKFDKAAALDAALEIVRSHIQEGLVDPNPRKRMLATACYLIDTLCLRVGDEKDPDEADTVGATTLRPEHVKIGPDGVVEFKFLGKDSVEWHKKLRPPQVVLDNLAELIANARPSGAAQNGDKSHPTRDKPQLFPDITSRDVNLYLSSIQPGLTAKVFRTHHATTAVQESLTKAKVTPTSPEYAKWQAVALANLQAAILCNHTKQVSTTWAATRARYAERRARAEERLEGYRQKAKEAAEALAALKEEAQAKEAAAAPEKRAQVRARYSKRLAAAQSRLEAARERVAKAQLVLGKLKAQATIAEKKRNWNLGTSLKSYIDPRVYHRWGQQVGYDVLGHYYPAILQRKFAWVKLEDDTAQEETLFTVRTCLAEDLPAVAQLFAAVRERYPQADLPLDPAEIGARYLPALGQDWREAVIALDEAEQVVGWAVLGPEWNLEGQEVLDIWGVVHPDVDAPQLAQALAEDVRRRLKAYALHQAKKALALYPRWTGWYAYAAPLAEALDLLEEEAEEALVLEPAEADPDETSADD